VTASRPRTTATHCPYCALQCGISLTAGNGPVSLAPADFPTNRGRLCAKGWSSVELLDHPERLTRPLVRAVAGDRTSPLVESTWDEALDRLVAAIEATRTEHGRDAVGCFGGGGLTNEQAYQFGKFARVALRSSSIDYNGRWCMSSAAGAAVRAFGLDRGMPFPLSDLAEADVVLVVGGNPAETMPPLMQYLEAGRSAGALHVVVDPRRTPTAQQAGLHLQPLPGTDLALANGLLHVVVAEGLVDEAYVAARTTGFDDVRAAVAGYWPDRVERITGVPVAELRRTAFALARAARAVVLTARGAEQHRSGTDTAQAWINLALALGLPGRPGSGWGTVTGQGNGQGGREHGQKADQLPGYRKLTDPAARAHVAAVWGVDPDTLPGPGPSAFELLDGLGTDGGVRTLLVLASNVAVSAPDARRVVRRLRDLDFLAVSDFFLSETAALADVVLPSAMWAEEEGTMTNLEGRVVRRRRAVAAPPEVRDDLALLAELAGRLGTGHLFSADPETVFAELGRASAGGPADYSGITYGRIDREEGVFWPCPAGPDGAPDHPGTPRLFTERFATPDGRARFLPVEHVAPHEEPDAEYPYVLTTGRVLAQYQSGAQTRRTPSLQRMAPEPRAELHPDLAARLGIVQDDVVELSTRRGRATFTATVTDTIRPDVVFAPFHWGGRSSANALTDPALDPISRMPAFKTCAVAVTRVGAAEAGDPTASPSAVPLVADVPPETVLGGPRRALPREPRTGSRSRLVVVGNGMAGARFVEEVLRRGGGDRFAVTVIGEEPHGNYNRILLPPLLAGEKRESDLLLNDHDWYADRGVRLRAGTTVTGLDRAARQITCSDGTVEPYDHLVLATGSRSFLPPLTGLQSAPGQLLPGAHLFRTVDDVRAILGEARVHRRAVVLGGGLLGLEAARALVEHGLRVDVVHAGPHLMETQLDRDAGELLQRGVEGLGIGVHVGAMATEAIAGERFQGLRLDDGRRVDGDLLVVAAGVRPETTLARAAGLPVERGVLVDDQLRTDDRRVSAIGECAQHRGRVYGLVAPVWEQAAVLAEVLAGTDPAAGYPGSRTATKLKVAGLEVATMGAKAPEPDDEHVVISEPRRGVHLSAIVRDDCLVGATLIGDIRRAAALAHAYDRGTPLPAERFRLLVDVAGAATQVAVGDLPADARVCQCNGVSKQTVCDAVAAGCGSLDAVMGSTRAGTGCGSCRRDLQELIDMSAGRGTDRDSNSEEVEIMIPQPRRPEVPARAALPTGAPR
jgi:assimilatory nitrate reductase catalytic subunit